MSRPASSLRRPALAAILTFAVGMLAPQPALAWWNCAWSSRVPLDVSAAAPGTNVVVEAALPAASLPGYPWAATDASLRVVDADDATVLPHFSAPRPGSVQRLQVWFRVPAIGPTPRRIYLYFNNGAATSTSTSSLFTDPGVRMLTKRLASGVQGTLGAFFTQFDAATQPVGYGCQAIPDYVNRSNATQFGAPGDVHYSMLFFIDVPSGQTGTWRFRLGPDFGYGGGLYVNATPLEQEWGTDLWWAGNFANTAEILQGSVSLAAGRHLVQAYGTEQCCEGLQAMQADRPGGGANWLDLRTSNFTLVAPSCPVAGLATVRVADFGGFSVAQAVATFDDPVAGATNPKSIPGARKRYAVTVRDAGNARAVDSNSVAVAVPVPANTQLYVGNLGGAGSGPVQFVNGTPASGLAYVYTSLASTTDDLDFSNNGGATWTYVPTPNVAGVDPAVTHLRVRPRGQPACTATVTPGNFELRFDVAIR